MNKLIIFILLVLLTSNAYATPVSENYIRIIEENAVIFYPKKEGLPFYRMQLQQDEIIVRSFGRGFLNNSKGGLFEYLHCFVTNHRRFWLYSSTGKIQETGPDEEIYLSK